jgi:hypothetical protein
VYVIEIKFVSLVVLFDVSYSCLVIVQVSEKSSFAVVDLIPKVSSLNEVCVWNNDSFISCYCTQGIDLKSFSVL